MINIWKESFIYKILHYVINFYNQGLIHSFFIKLGEFYEHSRFKEKYQIFIDTPMHIPSAYYGKIILFFHRKSLIIGGFIYNSLIFRICNGVLQFFYRICKDSVVAKAISWLGLKGILIIVFVMYLPLDYFLRNIINITIISSLWDEAFMVFSFLYILNRRGFKKSGMQTRANMIDGYIFLFMGVGIFLLCANSPHIAIAISGYRAVFQYILWFFIIIRLIEDDKDFTIFYYTLIGIAILIALHGVYQFIIRVPIPEFWISQTEEKVRTRVFSITGSPNIMGAYLVMFAPMVAAIMYYSKNISIKFMAFCFTGVMCLSTLFTFSKGAWGGMMLAIIIFSLFLDKRIIAYISVTASIALFTIPSIASRITYLFTDDYKAASLRGGRAVRWSDGLSLLRSSNEAIGFGLGRFGGAVAMQNQVIEQSSTFKYFYMDNYYLKTLVEMGYIGLIFYIILLVGLILWCLRSIGRLRGQKYYPLAVGMFSGMMGVLLHCYFENIFEVPYMLAYFWGLAAGIIYLGYFSKRTSISVDIKNIS